MMKQRRPLRLRHYDYSNEGMYFVTLCTYDKQCLFGEITNGQMQLNKYGKIAQEEWLNTESIRLNVKMGEYIIMPNHMHGIIHIMDREDTAYHDRRGKARLAPTAVRKFGHPIAGSLSVIVGGYKSAVTKRIRESTTLKSKSVWQRLPAGRQAIIMNT